jgi:hypothetical protein
MKRKYWPTLMAMAIIAGAHGVVATGHSEVVHIRLNAMPPNSGQIAKAVLVQQGNGTALGLLISGVPNITALPPHIYTFIYSGSCGNHDAKPTYSLNQRVVLGDRVPGRGMLMSKYVPTSVSDLTSSDYALVLRTGAADGNFDIFCGNLKHTS